MRILKSRPLNRNHFLFELALLSGERRGKSGKKVRSSDRNAVQFGWASRQTGKQEVMTDRPVRV